ncbi:MAG: M28 family peptidase [Promethearchaeota archaeon]
MPPLTEGSFSASLATHDVWSQNATLPSPRSRSVSSPESSPPSIAYVANVSTLAYWQRELAMCVNESRLLGLLTSLTNFNSRHPFTSDGNASIDFVCSYLTSNGISYTDDWFSIPKRIWNGTRYVYQYYWTRNLYITPWGINPSAPSLIITSHLDSAQHDLLGMLPTNAPGANDNAAGIASLLESLDILSQNHSSTLQWNVLFAFLGGEEGNGTLSLYGSNQLISHGLNALGINPITSLALNIDEIAYQGTIWPTILAMYQYMTEDVTVIHSSLTTVSNNLDIELIGFQRPRAENLASVQDDFGWCISEWTLHTNHIPSITISTNQYPDPYKHSLYDGLSHCALINVVNTTKLIIGLIVELTLVLPSNPPTLATEWIPLLSDVANITITDYLNPLLPTFQALVLDPLITVDRILANRLTSLSQPLLVLGYAGGQLLQETLSLSITARGTQTLEVQGLKAFHPVIQSPSLLKGQATQLFQNCSSVFAVTPSDVGLALVSNTTWASLSFYPPSLTEAPVLFLGVPSPEYPIVSQIAKQGLRWLLEKTSTGICMGLNQIAPKVGSSPILYVFAGDITNWTGYVLEPVHLNITALDFMEDYQVVTNETGTAQLELYLAAPTTYAVHAHSNSGLEGLYYLVSHPVCTAHLQYSPIIQQGEYLAVSCFINSSWATAATINLSLFEVHVGSISKTNLILVPGENLFHLNLEVLPSCPPQAFNLTLLITSHPLTLLFEQVPLTVQGAFILALVDTPDQALQNQLFLVTINLTNLGSQTRAFDIVAVPNFWGFAQVIVQSNETRSITFQIQYLPASVVDTGVRLLSLSLLSDNHYILSVEHLLLVGYSTVNLILSLLPLAFLIGLCVLGIIWMRNGKRRQQQSGSVQPELHLPGIDGVQIHWGSPEAETQQQRIPLNTDVKRQLTQIIHRLGLTNTSTNRYLSDRVILAWEKQGQELHIVLQCENRRLIQRLLTLLSESTLPANQEGDLRDS